jgi:DNA-directed RNA polymerase subunit omega
MRIENKFDNRYNLVKVAARRARQLQSGALPMVDTQSTKACRVAQDEIRARVRNSSSSKGRRALRLIRRKPGHYGYERRDTPGCARVRRLSP